MSGLGHGGDFTPLLYIAFGGKSLEIRHLDRMSVSVCCPQSVLKYLQLQSCSNKPNKGLNKPNSKRTVEAYWIQTAGYLEMLRPQVLQTPFSWLKRPCNSCSDTRDGGGEIHGFTNATMITSHHLNRDYEQPSAENGFTSAPGSQFWLRDIFWLWGSGAPTTHTCQ